MTMSLAILVSILIGPCQAHQEPKQAGQITIVRADHSARLTARSVSLDIVLEKLGSELGVSLLCDLPSRMDTANIEVEGPIEAILNEVARKYDLVWEQMDGIFLVRQGFCREGTRPQLLEAELRETAQDFVRIVRSVAPGISSITTSQPLTSLANSLDGTQVATLRKGGAIKIAELSPQQKSLVQTAMYASYVRLPAESWEELLFELRNLEKSYLQVRDVPDFYFRRNGQRLDLKGQQVEWKLTWALQYAPFREYEYPIPIPPPLSAQATKDANVRDKPAAAPIPADLTLASRGPLTDRLGFRVGRTTLSLLAKHLSEVMNRSVVVAPCLRDREVFAYVVDRTDKEFFKAITGLLGYECLQSTNGKIRIERKRVRLPRETKEIPASLQACFPSELLVFLGFRAASGRIQRVTDPSLKSRLERMPRSPNVERSANVLIVRELMMNLEKTAAEVLRTLVTPEQYTGKEYSLKLFDRTARQAVIDLLALRALLPLVHQNAVYFSGELKSLHLDLGNAELRALHDGSLSVTCDQVENGSVRRSGFGAQLENGLGEKLKPLPGP
jgi:hypothetical protein